MSAEDDYLIAWIENIVCEIALLKPFLYRMSASGLLVALTACGKPDPVRKADPGVPLHFAASSSSYKSSSGVSIIYPLPDEADPLDLRSCALSGIYGKMPCRLIGTKGPINKITWMDDDNKTAEASLEFDRSGRLQSICRRGHVDFQGWHCSSGPFSARLPKARTKLDDRGRIVQQQHDQFNSQKLDNCIYDDDSSPRSSQCKVDGFVISFTYDETGRALTYSRQRIPVPGESSERKVYLDKAYALDLKFAYRNDALGNWTEFEVTGKDPISGSDEVFNHQTLTIEYY